MNLILRNFLFCAILLVPTLSFARQNAAVQPLFFEQLHNALPANQPLPISTNGAVSEVTWQGLAWAVENVKTTHVPVVIEFYSADASDCTKFNPTGKDECTPQIPETVSAAAQFQGRVEFLRFNVQLFPNVLNGPDVRVLPTHIFIADFTDTQHYTAIKVWGLLDQQGLEQVVQQTFNIAP